MQVRALLLAGASKAQTTASGTCVSAYCCCICCLLLLLPGHCLMCTPPPPPACALLPLFASWATATCVSCCFCCCTCVMLLLCGLASAMRFSSRSAVQLVHRGAQLPYRCRRRQQHGAEQRRRRSPAPLLTRLEQYRADISSMKQYELRARIYAELLAV